MILIIVFLLVGLGTLAASEVTKNDTSTTKNTDKNTKISTENNIKDTTKTQPTQEKQIQKTQKLNKNQDSLINITNYNDLERELRSGSGTKILNINENITLGGNPTLSGSITNLIINGNQKTINGNGTQQFLTINSEQTVTINNLTITNCNASTGGAIYNDGGTLNINNSNLTQNNANLGGAILNRGNLTITNSNLEYNNINDSNGGAIWNSGTLNITHSNLTHNTAEGVNAGYGGAIYNVDISSITDTNLQYNNANRGGAIHNGGTLNITHSNLTHNTAKENGGAIHINSKGILNICGSDINNNTAPNGGAIYNYASNVTIYESTLNNNQGSGCGGAIYDYTGPHWNTKIIMFNSNFTENKAVNGTVLYNHGGNGNYTITYNLFKNNTASSDKETLTLGPINDRGRTVEQNTYDNTDINLTKINLTTQKIKYHYDEDIILNYTVDLAIPEYYDADILDKINKTLYIDTIENSTTKEKNYTLSKLKPGNHTLYYKTCNSDSNNLTLTVTGDSEIKTDKTTYDHVDGIKNKITLNIIDPSEEKGTINITVKDQNEYKKLFSYSNVGNEYQLSTDALVEALENLYHNLVESYTINISYTSDNEYVNLSSTEFTLKIKKQLNTTITITPIKSTIGSIIKLTAGVTDEKGENVTDGKVIFKINGITLKDESNNVIYASVVNGVAAINYKVQPVWMKNTTYIEAVYGGTTSYASSRTKVYDILKITKGKATIMLDQTSITAKSGETITLRAKVLDANGDRINNDKVVFKLNGKTLTDNDGKTLYAKVIDGEAILDYTLPPNFSAKKYTLTAIFAGTYYERTQTNGTIVIEKKGVTINTDSITAQDNEVNVKATITDETGSLMVTSTKLVFKVNGITILSGINSTNGIIDISFTTTLKPGMYELQIISGENGIYKSGKMTTVLKI
jgi:hypothetical protein